MQDQDGAFKHVASPAVSRYPGAGCREHSKHPVILWLTPTQTNLTCQGDTSSSCSMHA